MLDIFLYKLPKWVFKLKLGTRYDAIKKELTIGVKVYKLFTFKSRKDLEFIIPNIENLITVAPYVLNGTSLHVTIYMKNKFITYVLDLDIDKLKVYQSLSNAIPIKKQKFLKGSDTPKNKAVKDYEDNKEVITIPKKIVVDAFLNKKIAYPAQCFVDTDDRSCIILSVYFGSRPSKSRYDIAFIKNGITGIESKIILPAMTSKFVDINKIINVLLTLKINIPHEQIFYYENEEIIYPASIPL